MKTPVKPSRKYLTKNQGQGGEIEEVFDNRIHFLTGNLHLRINNIHKAHGCSNSLNFLKFF